jgi:NADH-quinone oxidoreductase subunit C
MALTNEITQQQLTEKFGDQVYNFESPFGLLTFQSPKEMNLKVLQFLYENENLQFTFLTDLCAVHYPDNKGQELAVVYLLQNLRENIRVRYKIFTDIQQPDIFTATKLFEAANWMERETYDFFGVNFIGHPNLKRVLNADEMDYFPL